MAKEPTIPKVKAKASKPVKSGIVKRTPVKTSPAKRSPTKLESSTMERDVVFLWKCIKLSNSFKIDWTAVAKDAGKSVGTVQKQWSRLNLKIERRIPTPVPGNTSDKEDNEEGDLVATSNDSE